MNIYYVYILTNKSGNLYIGVTNDLERRLHEHRSGSSEFTGKYRLTKLIYFETSSSIDDAIAREKQLKGWRREKKFQLIHSLNPELNELHLDTSTSSV